jgi:hypothetical protein
MEHKYDGEHGHYGETQRRFRKCQQYRANHKTQKKQRRKGKQCESSETFHEQPARAYEVIEIIKILQYAFHD